MPLDHPREVWTAVERCRRPGETWAEAAEREVYTAIVGEGMAQNRISEVMSCSKIEVNRRLQKYNLRPKDRRLAIAKEAV